MGQTWIQQAITVAQEGDHPTAQGAVWPHVEEGVHLPWPTKQEMHDLHTEFYQRAKGEPLGPKAAKWETETWQWAADLRRKHYGDTRKVTGLWQQGTSRWKRRLDRLQDRAQAQKIYKEVTQGVPLPFDREPSDRIWATKNHPDLGMRKQEVYNALIEQLEEGSLEGFDVRGGRRPKGLMSLRWVEKSDPSKVRLTLNGRPFNPRLPHEECTIKLETHAQLRSTYTQNQTQVGFDLHNGFFINNISRNTEPGLAFASPRRKLARS